MLVDDDPIVNMVNQTLIRCTDPVVHVNAFTSAEEALFSLPATCEQTIILLDLNMPHFDGWDFLDAFSALAEDVKKQFVIYVLSSSIAESDREKALEYNSVKDYLVKPLRKHALMLLLAPEQVLAVDADQTQF